jgi:hypothetical protein
MTAHRKGLVEVAGGAVGAQRRHKTAQLHRVPARHRTPRGLQRLIRLTRRGCHARKRSVDHLRMELPD